MRYFVYSILFAVFSILGIYARDSGPDNSRGCKKMKTSESIRGFTREIWELPEIDISGMRLVEIALEDARKDSESDGEG